MKIFSICHWWCTLSCEYLREFSKKFKTALMVYSGAWGKLIHEKKTRSRKSRDTVPLSYHPVVCLWSGFMMCTMFLSMWISNTAAVAMMVPIGMLTMAHSSVFQNCQSNEASYTRLEPLKSLCTQPHSLGHAWRAHRVLIPPPL